MPSPIFLISLDQQFLSDHRHLIEQSRELAHAYKEKIAVVEDEVLQKVGTSLWQALDCETNFLEQEQASGQDALNIIIQSDDAGVLNLAWETLYHPTFEFLARSERFTLSRQLPIQPAPKLPEIECTPLRILLFAAMPMDLREHGRLQIEEEKANILQAVTPLEDQGLVKLIAPEDGRFESFKQALQAYQPHLVYLSGHGSLHHNTIDNTYQGQFLFEDPYANSLEVPEHELVECFNNTQVQAIVLSACESGKFDARDLNNGLSIRLAQKGVPHVIGMRESIIDDAGLEFSITFIEQIASKQSIATSLQTARRAIKNYTPSGEGHEAYRTAFTKQEWCLPSLISHEVDKPLINWSFTPDPKETGMNYTFSLNNVSLPEQFLGRRYELYRLLQPLLNGTQTQLLITAAGGMGKTALAGKLCFQLKAEGFEVFAFSAKEGSNWSQFIASLSSVLTEDHAKSYEADKENSTSEFETARSLLTKLIKQFGQKVVLLLDNLESIQDPHTLNLTDNKMQLWLEAAKALNTDGLRLILTSRWRLPDWQNDTHHNLEKPQYSDFIAFARQKGLLATLSRLRLSRTVYDNLGGNFRALEFFVKASQDMNLAQVKQFLATLNQAKGESQTDMALEKVLAQRSEVERSLLTRLLAFPTAVPIKGISIVALKVSPPLASTTEHISALENLCDVSLIEKIHNHNYQQTDYQITPIIRDYLNLKGKVVNDKVLQIAVKYLYDNLLKERPKLFLAITIYDLLVRTNNFEDSQKLLLDELVPALNFSGLYNQLINEYLIPSLKYPYPPYLLTKTHEYIGRQYLHIGNYKAALKHTTISLDMSRKLGNKKSESIALNNIATVYQAWGKLDTALDYFCCSISMCKKLGDKYGEATTLGNISQVLRIKGENETALRYLEESLQIQAEIDDKSGMLGTLTQISRIYRLKGDYLSSLQFLQHALGLSKEINEVSAEADCLNSISRIYELQADYESAMNYLNKALHIKEKIGDQSGICTVLINISQINHTWGKHNIALGNLRTALELSQKAGEKSLEATALNNIAEIHSIRGNYPKALNYYETSLEIRESIGDKHGISMSLNNLSQIYHTNGDLKSALEYLEQSLSISQEIEDKSGESTALNNISQIYQDSGNNKASLAYLMKSLSILRKIGNKADEGIALNNISLAYSNLGDYDTALKYLKKSLVIQRKIHDISGLCATLYNIGHAHMFKNKSEQAISAWIEVYQLANESKDIQVLLRLEKLGIELGLKDGLEGWEVLAKQQST